MTASRDAFKSNQVDFEVRGGFTKNVADQLQSNSKLATEIVQMMLEGYFPGTWDGVILQKVGIEMTSKGTLLQKPDPKFRANILRAYGFRCPFCGFGVGLGHQPVALEAARIRWRQARGPDLVVNGPALCSLHHKLFDRGAFTLSNELEILVSDDAHGSVGFQEWLMCFHRKKLHFPQKQIYYPSENFTQWHVQEVFTGEYRE